MVEGEQINVIANKQDDSTVCTSLANQNNVFAVRHPWPGRMRGLLTLLLYNKDGLKCVSFNKSYQHNFIFHNQPGQK